MDDAQIRRVPTHARVHQIFLHLNLLSANHSISFSQECPK